MVIDPHAHHVPLAFLAAVEREPAHYPVFALLGQQPPGVIEGHRR